MSDKWDEAVEIFTLGAEMSLNYHDEPIKLCYSGGKDSDVLLEVAKASGQPFILSYNVTTIDAPDTIRHIKEVFRREEQNGIKCTINQPTYKGQPITMWKLIPIKLMPPTRVVRYCCAVLKEQNINEHVVATGVRWDESPKRSTRKPVEAVNLPKDKRLGYDPTTKQMTFFSNDNTIERKIAEHCEMGKKTAVNPIIKFTDREIWQIIYDCHIKINTMYDKGYDRVGCIGCPMAQTEVRYKEFADYPIFKQRYIRAFEEMLKFRKAIKSQLDWQNGQEVFDWWMYDKNLWRNQIEMNIKDD